MYNPYPQQSATPGYDYSAGAYDNSADMYSQQDFEPQNSASYINGQNGSYQQPQSALSQQPQSNAGYYSQQQPYSNSALPMAQPQPLSNMILNPNFPNPNLPPSYTNSSPPASFTNSSLPPNHPNMQMQQSYSYVPQQQYANAANSLVYPNMDQAVPNGNKQAYPNMNQAVPNGNQQQAYMNVAQNQPYAAPGQSAYASSAQQMPQNPAMQYIPNLPQAYANSGDPQQLAPFHIPQQRTHAANQQQPSQLDASRPTNASSYGGADVVYTGPGEMPKPAFGFSCDQGMRSENEDRLVCHPRLISGSVNPPTPPSLPHSAQSALLPHATSSTTPTHASRVPVPARALVADNSASAARRSGADPDPRRRRHRFRRTGADSLPRTPAPTFGPDRQTAPRPSSTDRLAPPRALPNRTPLTRMDGGTAARRRGGAAVRRRGGAAARRRRQRVDDDVLRGLRRARGAPGRGPLRGLRPPLPLLGPRAPRRRARAAGRGAAGGGADGVLPRGGPRVPAHGGAGGGPADGPLEPVAVARVQEPPDGRLHRLPGPSRLRVRPESPLPPSPGAPASPPPLPIHLSILPVCRLPPGDGAHERAALTAARGR
jgi:hypothetical protein